MALMERLTITKQQARRFLLAHQSLWPPRQLRSKRDILGYINRVGCIQFDPLNIVGYNHELVLQARVSEFNPVMLQVLLYKDRELLDGWDKNMSIYCTKDWPYFSRNRRLAKDNLGNSSRPATLVLSQVRDEIEKRGPMSSADLDFKQTVPWSWAPTRLSRAVLESMYFWGELVIHHRVHTRKIYDFTERHIPKELLSASDPNETDEQYHDWYIYRRIGGIGLVWNKSGDAWLGISGIKSRERSEALVRLLEKRQVMEVQIEGIDAMFYLRDVDKPILEKSSPSNKPLAAILAPLDNLLWDRKLLKELFNFDYRWEVYKPAASRQYGYYVLPILYGDRFVARFEPGRNKRSGTLIIKNWWWEPEIEQTEDLFTELYNCFNRFMNYLNARDLQIDNKVKKQEGLDWLASLTTHGRRAPE